MAIHRFDINVWYDNKDTNRILFSFLTKSEMGVEMNIVKFALVFFFATTAGSLFAQSSGQFEDPVLLQVGDEIMNQDGAMMYPSPAIFDVDNDGQNELVIGTIFGGLFACENSNPKAGLSLIHI